MSELTEEARALADAALVDTSRAAGPIEWAITMVALCAENAAQAARIRELEGALKVALTELDVLHARGIEQVRDDVRGHVANVIAARSGGVTGQGEGT